RGGMRLDRIDVFKQRGLSGCRPLDSGFDARAERVAAANKKPGADGIEGGDVAEIETDAARCLPIGERGVDAGLDLLGRVGRPLARQTGHDVTAVARNPDLRLAVLTHNARIAFPSGPAPMRAFSVSTGD